MFVILVSDYEHVDHVQYGMLQQDCEYDSVEIRSGLDQNSRVHGTYCGSHIPAPVTSESNRLRIAFTTDNTVQKSGFSAYFFTGKH